MKKALKLLSNLTTLLLFVLLIVMAVLVIMMRFSGDGQTLFGYQLKTVLSGSMEPEIKTGSIIAVKPGGDTTRFQEGDVITYQLDHEGNLSTHRVVEVLGTGDTTRYVTKGDNNNAVDNEPVLHENVVAEYTGFTIPYVGYVLEYSNSKIGSALLLIIPGTLFLGYAFLTIVRALKEFDKNQSDNVTIKN